MSVEAPEADAVAVEPAGEADAPLLAEMMFELWRRNGPDARLPQETEALLAALLAVGHQAHLFRRGSEVVGYALTRDGGDHAFIRHFLIRPAHRGRGTGRAALAALEARIGPRQFRLDVMDGDAAAMGFWRAMGFAPAATSMRRAAK